MDNNIEVNIDEKQEDTAVVEGASQLDNAQDEQGTAETQVDQVEDSQTEAVEENQEDESPIVLDEEDVLTESESQADDAQDEQETAETQENQEDNNPEDNSPIVLDEEDVLDDAESSEKPEVSGMKWYIIQCYALYEQKVRDRIIQMQEDEFKGIVERVLLPEEETVEIKNNERKERVKKMFPGYLFVQMKPDETVWYLLRRLPGVAKLVGIKNEPTPVSEEEIDRILRQLGEKAKKIEVDFELNEVIKVISGPFRGYTGEISEINAERGKLKSLISIFGRETPVELDFDQVEKYIDNK
jgi:transcription termination/antitermination protein NusG